MHACNYNINEYLYEYSSVPALHHAQVYTNIVHAYMDLHM